MKKIIIAITLIVIGSVGVSILSPTISMADDNKPAASDDKKCPSGKILTLKPWYDGLMEKNDCSLKTPPGIIKLVISTMNANINNPMTVFVQISRAFLILSGLPSEVVYKNAPYITAPTAAIPIPAVKILMTCLIMLIIAVLPVPSQEITEVSAPPQLAAKAILGIKTLPAITVVINMLIIIFLFVIKFSLIQKL